MKKNVFLAFIVSLAIVTAFSGCASNVSTTKPVNFDKRPLKPVAERKFYILGPVTLEKEWFGVLGAHWEFSVGFLPSMSSAGDSFLYQKGGVSYVDLFNKAKEQYPDTDAVIDINVDYEGTFYSIFYAKRKHLVHGIAIKYVADPTPGDPSSVDFSLNINSATNK
jgi:hypothetical protein